MRSILGHSPPHASDFRRHDSQFFETPPRNYDARQVPSMDRRKAPRANDQQCGGSGDISVSSKESHANVKMIGRSNAALSFHYRRLSYL